MRLFKHLPTPHEIRQNRFLKPVGRYLHHPYLWQLDRRSVAGGVAVGLFFGILTPFAQILFSAIAAIVFRFNLPIAVLSTLVTNPITFPFVYYFAYKLGGFLTGRVNADAQDLSHAGEAEQILKQQTEVSGWLTHLVEWAQTVGFPLMTGLIVLAITAATTGYFLVNALWRAQEAMRRRRRGHDDQS